MKKTLIFLSLVVLGLGAMADNQPDAIYRLIRRQYTINQDGTMDINYRKELTILRNRALTAYADKGETFITYNPDLEELTINESYTLTPDGRKVVTPQNAFVKQLPEVCADCGRYNSIVELAVIHTGMEYNCTIVLDYTIHRKEILRGDLFTMQADCPVEKYEIIYDHGGRVLHYDVPTTGTLVQDQHSFHWVATDIPQKSAESYVSATDPYQVSVKFRTFVKPDIAKSLPEATDVLGDIYQEDTMAYILAIRDWVRDNIHHNPVSPALTNYEATPAAEVLRSNCGNQLDHYVLLVAMLRQAGFEADLDDEMFEGDIYQPQQLRVAVRYDGMPYLLAMNQRPAHVKGGARELDKVVTNSAVLSPKPERIGENYYAVAIPIQSALQVSPAQLTTQRTQPLEVRPVKESISYTIQLDGSYKLLNPVKLKYKKKGLGSIEITVRQVDDHTVSMTRHLEILPTTVETKQYADFRQMVIDWNSHKGLILQKK